MIVTAIVTDASGQQATATAEAAIGSAYDAAVLAGGPVLFHSGADGQDASGNGLHGTLHNNPGVTMMPNGDPAPVFDGSTQYIEVADHDPLSVPTTGRLTFEAWIRPDVLEFPNDESSGYVHWAGKSVASPNAEWQTRMYSLTNTENRPNRISGYAYNNTGGLGVGGYFQDAVTAGEWIHVVFVINKADAGGSYPDGYGKIYKNGVLRRQDNLNYNGTSINPSNTTAPFRIGTTRFNSWFPGAIGKPAVFDYELTAAQIQEHYAAMTS